MTVVAWEYERQRQHEWSQYDWNNPVQQFLSPWERRKPPEPLYRMTRADLWVPPPHPDPVRNRKMLPEDIGLA